MTRRAFYSFYYADDSWRASQVRNMGVVDGNQPATDNDWEEVKKGGGQAIKDWINRQLNGKSVVVVLVGSNTSGRKWINYEIEKGWKEGKGMLAIYIHNLKDSASNSSTKGTNPFWGITVNGTSLFSTCKVYDPPYVTSTYVYDHIKENLSDWIEEAITIRNNN